MSNCPDCIQNNIVPASFYSGRCVPCETNEGCPSIINSQCVVYTGPNLTCSAIATNMCLELALQKIDNKLCTVIGDYSGYNLSCLRSSYAINTAQQFAEGISDFVCKLRTDFDTFSTVTYPAGIANLQTQINTINAPNITSCAAVGIINTDSLNVVLGKIVSKECDLFTALDISAANWSQCFVVTTPTTLVEGFNVVLSQICSIKNSGTTLPTFNNVGTCLASPGTNDSLVDTITKMRTRLCLTPTFNAANLTTSTCVSFTSSSTLEQVINSQNSVIDTISQNSIRAVSNQFTITAIDPSQPCLGKQLSLASGVLDRLVALNTADLTPGTLFDKVAAGANISLDFGTLNAGKLTITSTGGVQADEKVKATSLDSTAGYLDSKLTGGSNAGLTITASPVPSNDKIAITPNINLTILVGLILDTIEDDADLKARFCAIVASCPSPCDAPSNISVTYS